MFAGSCVKVHVPDYAVSCCLLSATASHLLICPKDTSTVDVIKLDVAPCPPSATYGNPDNEGIEIRLDSWFMKCYSDVIVSIHDRYDSSPLFVMLAVHYCPISAFFALFRAHPPLLESISGVYTSFNITRQLFTFKLSSWSSWSFHHHYHHQLHFYRVHLQPPFLCSSKSSSSYYFSFLHLF